MKLHDTIYKELVKYVWFLSFTARKGRFTVKLNFMEKALKIIVASVVTLGIGLFSLLGIATTQDPKFDAYTLFPYALLAALALMWWGIFRKPSTETRKLPQWVQWLLLAIVTAVLAYFLYNSLVV